MRAESDNPKALVRERWKLLSRVETSLDKPMVALSIVWLGLLVLEFTGHLTTPLRILGYVIWVLFGVHFLLGFVIAPDRWVYLRHNWLTAVSLPLPALRIFRIFRALRFLRAARTVRSAGLLRLVSSVNRGMRSLSSSFGRRGLGYVLAITIIVAFAGAALMLSYESPGAVAKEFGRPVDETVGLNGYSEALWWTAMVLATMGTDYWPRTPEGRILCLFLALYAFASFGYITATLATYFVGKDATTSSGKAAVNSELASLRREVAALRRDLSMSKEQRG
ncbi:MAG: ion transporter [Verrucomicrobiia bacterium]